MDPVAVALVGFGFGIGWWTKSCYPDPVAPTPCTCECHCVHNGSLDNSSSYGSTGVALALLVGLIGLVANAALAFKVTVVSGSQGREVAFQVKGKSKGVYNPSRSLEITQ